MKKLFQIIALLVCVIVSFLEIKRNIIDAPIAKFSISQEGECVECVNCSCDDLPEIYIKRWVE